MGNVTLKHIHPRPFLATDPASDAEEAAPVTSEDERKMLCFYYKQIMKICAGLNFPTKVKVSAGASVPGGFIGISMRLKICADLNLPTKVKVRMARAMRCCAAGRVFSRGHSDGPGGRSNDS